MLYVHASHREYPGPPDAGNPHVRWDEGEGSRNILPPPYSTGQ